MSQATRNVIGFVVAVVAGYIALALAGTVDSVLSYPRSSVTAIGEILLMLTALWPFLFSAAVVGIVAAFIARPPRPRAWLLVVSTLAVARYALALRYVAPDWQEWLKTIIAAALIGATAACTFSLVAHQRGSKEQDSGGREPLAN